MKKIELLFLYIRRGLLLFYLSLWFFLLRGALEDGNWAVNLLVPYSLYLIFEFFLKSKFLVAELLVLCWYGVASYVIFGALPNSSIGIFWFNLILLAGHILVIIGGLYAVRVRLMKL